MGVISFIVVTSSPEVIKPLIAESLPVPGPCILTDIVLIPDSITFFATFSAVTCAAYGVDFLDPLKPLLPDEDQAITDP
jgi:hypothetical protein